MFNQDNQSSRAPGVYLIPKNAISTSSSDQFGTFQAFASGYLSSREGNEKWVVLFEGILFRDYASEKSDAEYILQKFSENEDIRDITGLKGFYNVIVIHIDGEKGFFLGDLLCSRPLYLYHNNNQIALAPSPLFFAEAGLPMS